MKIAISGASGKTGYRVAEEALAAGYEVRLLIRNTSELPQSLKSSEQIIISLSDEKSLDNSKDRSNKNILEIINKNLEDI